MRKAARVLFSRRISDGWKEIALPIYASQILFASLKLALLLVIILSPIIVVSVLLSLSLSGAFDYIIDFPGVLLIPITIIGYLLVRTGFFNARLF